MDARGPIEVGVKRTTYTVGLALSLAALAVGAWVVAHLGFFPPVAIALAMFAIGAAVFLWLLATGPYVFRIDARGLHDRSGPLAAGRVEWSELAEIRVVTADGRAQIGLVLVEAARARRGLVAQSAMDALRKRHGVDFVIPPEAIGGEGAEAIVAKLEQFRSDPARLA